MNVNNDIIKYYRERTGKDIFELAWTGLNGNQIKGALKAKNMLDVVNVGDNPVQGILRLMKTPEYLFYAAKALLNIELAPFQALILEELWKRPYPMLIASRGASKSFLLATFILLKMRLCPGTKIVACGVAFRQSRLIWETCMTLHRNAEVLQSTMSKLEGAKREVDMCRFTIGDSIAYFCPIGDGNTIRGLRSNCTIVDEFKDLPPEVYETVIAGFGAVLKSPINAYKAFAERMARIQAGTWTMEMEDGFRVDYNQSIIAGTCGYDFEHFSRYHKTYRKIITCQNDFSSFNEEEKEKYSSLHSEDFSIIRIPVDLIPEGFMDMKTIARNKASMLDEAYQREYGTVFVKDSEGFFKKSLIESCVASPQNGIEINNKKIVFSPRMRGSSDLQYIMGVDPASEKDNLAITILELHGDHTRLVYCWTVNRAKFNERIKAGIVKEHDYFQFCVQKIRDLCKDFNICSIIMDAQGGGRVLQQALVAPKVAGEQPIYEVIEEDKEKITDRMPGLHILKMIEFNNSKWVSESNHGLKYDMQQKLLLFPDFDMIELALSYNEDFQKAKEAGIMDPDMMSLYDTLEDNVMEIQILKEELATIIHTSSPNGTERWGTPDVAQNGKKGKIKKDRYTALLLANSAARTTGRIIVTPPKYTLYGMIAGQTPNNKNNGTMYAGRPDMVGFGKIVRS